MTKDQKPESSRNRWICDSERTVLTSPVMEIVERACHSSEDDRTHLFYLLKSRDWCNIIPVTEDGKIVLVRQYRIGISDHTLEIPGGVNDPEDPDFQSAAVREMSEETGYVPLPGARCVPLGWTFPNPAILNNRCYSFVVGPVRRSQEQKLDLGEMIDVIEVPIEELCERLNTGEINHALILTAFLRLAFQEPETRMALNRSLQSFTKPI